jgi:S1-C subfamily serine protease
VSYKDFRAMLVAISTSSSGNVVGRVRSSNNDSLLQIKAVQPSGVLDRLGLEAGDVVIALQGEAIGGLAQAESVLNAVRPGTTLLVVYRRAESVRQLSIEVRRQDGGG